MAPRDYVGRSGSKKKKKKQAKKMNKSLLLIIAFIVVMAFAYGLYLLKEKTPEVVPVVNVQDKTQSKSILPTPPQEVWSYIKALETRTVPVDNNPQSLEKNMRLTEEQKKVLLAMERERKDTEERRKTNEAASVQAVQPDESKLVTELNKQVEAKKTEQKKALEQSKKVETTQLEQRGVREKKFGLQCGAFRNKQQAENMQARLAMVGFNAQINSNGDWNRVVVGPLGDRAVINKALEKTKSVANCVVIGM